MRTFLAIAPNAWGKSTESVAKAIKAARKHVPTYIRPGYTVQIFQIDGDFFGVDGLGRIEYSGTLTDISDNVQEG